MGINTRHNWVDYGKGVGILLVVYAHLLSSAFHAGIPVPARFFALSDSIVYSFHMPFFFFLAGLFAETSLQKRGTRDYLKDKFARIFYPYLIWSVLQVGAEVLFAKQSYEGATWADMAAVLYRPWGQFWFLYALLWMHVAFAGFTLLGKYAKYIMLAAAVVLFLHPISTGIFALGGFSTRFIFFAGAIFFKEQVMRMGEKPIPAWGVALLLVWLFGSAYLTFTKYIEPARLSGAAHPFAFPYLALAGIIACSVLAQYLARNNLLAFLQTLGRYSLQIYLVHMLAGVGMRIILQMAGIQNWVIHIIFGTAFGLIAPILLQKVSDRLNFPYLFGLGNQKSPRS